MGFYRAVRGERGGFYDGDVYQAVGGERTDEQARAALALVGAVLPLKESGPYRKIPELDEVAGKLQCHEGDARERAGNALARGGWRRVGDEAVWNKGVEAHAEIERAHWAHVEVL